LTYLAVNAGLRELTEEVRRVVVHDEVTGVRNLNRIAVSQFGLQPQLAQIVAVEIRFAAPCRLEPPEKLSPLRPVSQRFSGPVERDVGSRATRLL
jgi:hypothetical protein